MPSTKLTTGQRIRAERIRLGLTQQACALALGVSRGTWDQLEKGTNPKLGTLVPLRDKLGMDLRRVVPELFHACQAGGRPKKVKVPK